MPIIEVDEEEGVTKSVSDTLIYILAPFFVAMVAFVIYQLIKIRNEREKKTQAKKQRKNKEVKETKTNSVQKKVNKLKKQFNQFRYQKLILNHLKTFVCLKKRSELCSILPCHQMWPK